MIRPVLEMGLGTGMGIWMGMWMMVEQHSHLPTCSQLSANLAQAFRIRVRVRVQDGFRVRIRSQPMAQAPT